MEKSPLALAIDQYEQLARDTQYAEFSIPEENPGPPFYARIAVLGTDTLFLNANGTVVVPFMREIASIDTSFNLLNFFHVPNAFSCPLYLTGKGLIEKNATPDKLPVISFLESSNMPVWLFDAATLRAAMQDDVLTISELRSLNPIEAIAKRYIEYNKPRAENGYLLVIEMEGIIPATNQKFTFSVNDVNRVVQDIQLTIK